MQAAKLYEPILGPVLEGLRAHVLDIANLNCHDIFLDCCCGAGGLLKLSAVHKAKLSLGLDLSLAMLWQSQKNAPHAHLACANAMQLPLSDKCINVASVCMALHAIPVEIAKLCVKELCRVSKRVIIADYCLLERNAYIFSYIASNIVERLVGGEHYLCYKEFMRMGGIEGFLYQFGYFAKTRRSTLGGCARVLELEI